MIAKLKNEQIGSRAGLIGSGLSIGTGHQAICLVTCSFKYVDWIRRATERARCLATMAGVRECWAGHVARRSASTWLWCVTAWRDAEWTRLSLTSSSMRPLRPSRRRWVKWEHTLQRFTQQEGLGWWTTFACGGFAQQWLQHQDAFGAFVCSSLGTHVADG